MDTILQLKNKIVQRILKIDDVNLLKSIDHLFNLPNANLTKFLAFANDALQEENENLNETENFNEYIKEWVKNMK